MTDRNLRLRPSVVRAGAGREVDLQEVVVRRTRSLFADDLDSQRDAIFDTIKGARVLVAGGGGTIGAATTSILFDYAPASVVIIDQSENYLVELVRNLRGRPGGIGDAELKTLPLDYGGAIAARLLTEETPFDIVLNFAALKHVRSEKDVYSLLSMLETNIVSHIKFKRALNAHGHGQRYFAVSTDKAANPTSLMGASKRLMEDVAFDVAADAAKSTTSVRFANVAFSNGSLLDGYTFRFAAGQPLAAPRDTRRYFVTQREAGELCVLAALVAPDRHVVFPRLDPRTELQLMTDVAERIVEAKGYRAVFYDDEQAAKLDAESLIEERRWPILLTPLDTSGEKPYEEFIGAGEAPSNFELSAIASLRHIPGGAEVTAVFEMLDRLTNDASAAVDKQAIVDAIASALPNFTHRETGRHLDQRF